jgi:hypothetical protein
VGAVSDTGDLSVHAPGRADVEQCFRGAVVIPPRPGETQVEVEFRGEAFSWAVARFTISFAGLVCNASIVWQALEHY